MTTTTATVYLPPGTYMKVYQVYAYLDFRDFTGVLLTLLNDCPVYVGQSDYYNTLDLQQALGAERFREMESKIDTYTLL
jgi:hypothetical protein